MSRSRYGKNIPKLNIKNNETSNFLQLGGSMILGPKFDIKQYLNNINSQQFSAKKESDNLPPLFDNLYPRSKNDNKKYELSTIVNNHLQNHRKIQNGVKSPSFVSTNRNYNNNNITMVNNKNRNQTLNVLSDENFKLKLNKNSFRESFSTETNLNLYKTYKLKNSEDENFNFAKQINEIKKYAELSSKNKSIKNIMGSKIPFSPKNLDVVFKPINIINSYNKFKQSELFPNKDEISSFLEENKEISRKNLIIKLLYSQKKNYQNDLNERKKTIDNSRRNIEMNLNNFSIFSTSQKIACRKLDDLASQLVIASRKLLKEMYRLRSEVRIKEDEKQKYLERIDELRFIAKFVTKVLGYNFDIFKFEIIPEYSSERLPDYEKISKEVFERYKIFLEEEEEENEDKENPNIIKQMKDLNDPELLYDQFYQIEKDITNTLNNKEIIEKEIVEIKNEGKKQTEDILKRIEVLEKEFDSYKNLYEREQNEYEELYKRNCTKEGEYDDYIKDIYYDIFGIENNNKKSKKNYFNVNKAASDILKTITDKEAKINKLINGLEQYEKDDTYLFLKLAHHRKNNNKKTKINIMMKKIMESGEKKKINQLATPEEKIIFIQRKCEPPFHAPKKKKIVVIDPELIKLQENEELITYK